MRLLGRPVPRFLVWVTFLVAVAVVSAAAGLRGWLIAVVELAAWAIVTLVERTLWRGTGLVRHRDGADSAPVVAAPVEPDVGHEAQTGSIPEPVTVSIAAEAVPVAVREPAWRRSTRQPVRTTPIRSPISWNVWSLEKIADAHPEVEELEFMAVSLREFANADGQLPADFDPLVRESFGDLLPS